MDIDSILKVVEGIVLNKYINRKVKTISVDTRTMKKNDLFIALKGKNFNSHKFLEEAIKMHACALIVDEPVNVKTDIPVIVVKDTYKALIDISSYIRNLYNPYVIAVTGSVGKSTTKELIYDVLKEKYHCLKNNGNYNNHIGIPKTIFKLNKNHEILITELGMNHFNEIDKLSKLVKPDMSVITKIGSSHIGNMGSVKNIFKAKLEIINGMRDGYLLVNGDDDYLKKIRLNNIKTIKCGLLKYNSFKPYNIIYTFNKTIFYLDINGKGEKFTFLPGKHLLTNALIAIKIGLMFGIKVSNIKNVLKNYKPYKQRMNTYNLKNNCTIVDDTYNASLESIKGLVDLSKLDNRKKIYVIGDILELGNKSKRIHKKVGKYISKIPNSELLLYGVETKYIKGHHFSNKKDIIDYLIKKDLKNTIILIKGSRKMQLEDVVSGIKTGK